MKSLRICLTVLVIASMLPLAGLAGEEKQVKLDVSGMMCNSCQGKVKGSLEKVAGVKNADVNWEKGSALVTLAKADVKNDDLIKAVKAADPKFSAKVAGKEAKAGYDVKKSEKP